MGLHGINGVNVGQQELTGVNGGCQILDIEWVLSELFDIKQERVEGSGVGRY